MISVGTKSILFGVHQFILHPIMVILAWIYLYKKLPNFKELVCIIIHDWGYWGLPNMDGKEGSKHPEVGAKIAAKLFGKDYQDLCLYHSRTYARINNVKPSKLCWADKLSITYNPWWVYVPLSLLSGEIYEYRKEPSAENANLPLTLSNKEWFLNIRADIKKQVFKHWSE